MSEPASCAREEMASTDARASCAQEEEGRMQEEMASTEALVRALAPHIVGGESKAREAAAHLPHTLDLHRKGIGAEGVKALAPHLPAQLQTLILSGNELGDEGAAALAPHLPKAIRTLCLDDNEIGAQGAAALGPHLPAALLTTLAACF